MSLLEALRRTLPRGLGLDDDGWRSRHRIIVALLWLHTAGILVFALVRGFGLRHAAADAAVVAVAAALAQSGRLARWWRALVATLGLLTSSALVVHLSGGSIEAHFHFFVMIAIITLYQEWRAFLLAVGYVVVHHGLLAAVAPTAVYDHAAAWNRPWTWAAVHGAFILAASAASVVSWRMNEDARAAARKQHQFLGLLERAAVASNEAPDFVAAAQVVLDEVCAATQWPLGHAYLFPEGATELQSTAVWHLADPGRYTAFRAMTEETRFEPGVGLPGRVLVEGRLVWILDMDHPGLPRAAAAREAGVKSGIAFPVLAGADVVGVLEFFASEAVRPDDALFDVMAHIGTQLGRLVERERAADRLGRSEELLAEAQRVSHSGSWEWDPGANLVRWSAELYRLLGLAPDELEPTYERYLARVHPDDRETVAGAVAAAYDSGRGFVLDHRIVRGDNGEVTWLHCRGRSVPAQDGRRSKMVGSAQDITERKQAEAALAESEERFRLAQRDAPNGLALVGLDGRFVQVNPALCALVGRPEEELLELSFQDITHPDDIESGLAHMERLLAGGGQAFELEKRYIRPDGQVVWALLSGSVARDANGNPLYMISQTQDITERRQAQQALREANERLRELATTDPLTGLPNRSLFADRLDHDLALAQRHGHELALLFVDLDRFKHVNDSLGHACGDELLVEVARRLQAAVRPSDTVARLGGDEFAVLLSSPASPEDAASVAERVLESLGQSLVTGGVEVHAGASIGVACWPEDCGSKEELIQHADAAMYRAKAAGGNRFEMFQPAMTVAARERHELEQELRRATERGELFLRYQPQVDLATGEIVAVEALVRWSNEERGEVAPTDFIPLAEETGLILPIGAWVLDRACRQVMEWRRTLPGASALRVAVNVSARQLADPGFVGLVRETLKSTALPASGLELEITEGMIVAGVGPAATAGELRALGVSVAVDDFGTGCSSLAYLRRFPVDRLKLDRSFIAGLGSGGDGMGEGDAAIVAAAIRMAHALGLEAVAEGVESQDQLSLLRRFGCELGQGYLWTGPLLASEVAGWLFVAQEVSSLASA